MESSATGRPFFSVIICTYNRAAVMVGAVEAVLAQTFSSFELIVVNDGSSDNTREACDLLQDPRLRCIHRENGGLSAARNTGLQAAVGTYVIFVDDDDRVEPNWLRALNEAVASSSDPSNLGVVSCGARFVDPSGAVLETRLPEALSKVFVSPARVVMLAGCFAVRRDIYGQIGGYEEKIQTTHQTELALRLLPHCERNALEIATVDQPLVNIESRAISERPLNQPGPLLESIEFVLEHHRSQLRRDRSTHAQYHSVAGVSSAQIGQMRRARRHLMRAALTWPTPHHLGRFAAAHVPGVERVWRRHWD